MPWKTCAKCNKLIPYGRTYCDRCQEAVDEVAKARSAELKKLRDARYNQRRDPKYKRFYNSRAWQRLRDSMMAHANFECEVDGCCRTAVELHHDPPISTEDGWRGRLDPANCHPLCMQHHNEAHKRFQKRKSPRIG